jgi:hypothetical protein
MKVLIVNFVLAALMMSCGTTRKARLSEFKELTKDMRIKTHDEAKIAQVLYLKMIKNK